MATLGIVLASAQTGTVKHTVDRGETLASIAQRYATTEAKIIELNPDAAQFVYVGMTLIIPNAQEPEQSEVPTAQPYPSNSFDNGHEMTLSPGEHTPTQSEEISLPMQSNEYTPHDFCFWGVSYQAAFDAADKGSYMIGGNILHPSGWGMDYHLGFNYGLVDKDYAGFIFLIGPAYGHVFNNVLISASLDFIGTYYGTGKGTDSKFNWGIGLMPKAAIKLGKVIPWLGINAQWAKGSDKLSVGFQVGIGFNI